MNYAKHVLFAIALVISASVAAQERQLESTGVVEQKVELSPLEQALDRAPIKSLAAWQQHLAKGKNKSYAMESLQGNALDNFSSSLRFNEKGLTGFSYADLSGMTATEAHNLLSLFGFQHAARLVSDVRIETPLDLAVVNGAFSLSTLPVGKRGREKTLEEDLQALWDSLFWNDFVDPSGAQDHKEYQCIARATCGQSAGFVCLRTC